MSYELSHPDPYNRKDVENMMNSAENFASVVARNQPGFMKNYPWARHVRAVIAGEWMRFCSNPPYSAKVEFWKITQEGEFIAYGISRETQYDAKEPTKITYPLVGFIPLRWNSPDTFSALEFFVDNWLRQGFKTVWFRAPFGEAIRLSDEYKVWSVTAEPSLRIREITGFLPYYTIYAIELIA